MSLVRRETALRFLVPIFFLSGSTALVYQTVWARALHLVFGTSQVAIGTVLAGFMAGLAIGGAVASRWADSVKRPLRVYAWLEAGIGVYALLFPVLVNVITPVYLEFWRGFDPSPVVFALVQAALGLVLLLLPTAFMGATLPLLARFATTHTAQTGRRVGLLYGVNTFGAVVGIALSGFVLMPAIGVQATTYVAAFGNLALAVLAELLSRWARSGDQPLEVEHYLEQRSSEREVSASRSLLWIAGLAGMAALVYELAWFRLMTLMLGGSVYAFSLMLLAFLSGIAFGGWFGGPIADRLWSAGGRRRVLLGVFWAQCAVGLLSYTMMWLYGELPYAFVVAYDIVERAPEFFWPFQLVLCAMVMTVPAVFMGITFPLLVRAAVDGPDRLGKPVGQTYAANTAGGIVGSLLAAFWLLPELHISGTILFAAGLNVVALCVVAFVALRMEAARRLRGAAGLIFCAWMAASLLPPPWNPLLMNAGMYKYVTELSSRTREGIRNFAVEGYDLLYYAEGLSSVVTVAQSRESGNIWLANNGKVEASTTVDMPTQLLVGHLPFLFNRPLERACVIGLASGITAGAVTVHDGLESIDIVELEPDIIPATKFFHSVNHRPLEDPRTQIITNDGRNHLLRMAPGTYDVIVSEPSNPWLSGVSNLFTEDFFRMGKTRLAEGGIWSQWVQIYGLGEEELQVLLRTFSSVFPHVMLFATIEDADLVLVGSETPLTLDVEHVRAEMERSPRLNDSLRAIEMPTAVEVISLYQMEREGILETVGDGRLNTDDNMYIEFAAPRHLHDSLASENYRMLLAQAETAIEATHTEEDRIALAEAYAAGEEWVKALLVLQGAVERGGTSDALLDLTAEYRTALRASLSILEE